MISFLKTCYFLPFLKYHKFDHISPNITLFLLDDHSFPYGMKVSMKTSSHLTKMKFYERYMIKFMVFDVVGNIRVK